MSGLDDLIANIEADLGESHDDEFGSWDGHGYEAGGSSLETSTTIPLSDDGSSWTDASVAVRVAAYARPVEITTRVTGEEGSGLNDDRENESSASLGGGSGTGTGSEDAGSPESIAGLPSGGGSLPNMNPTGRPTIRRVASASNASTMNATAGGRLISRTASQLSARERSATTAAPTLHQAVTTTTVVKEGLLQKSGGKKVFKHWDLRYFRLTGIALSYYNRRSDSKARGRILLADVTSVRVSRDPVVKSRRRLAPFEVSTTDRTFILYGRSAEESTEWMEVILELCPNAELPVRLVSAHLPTKGRSHSSFFAIASSGHGT